MRIAVIVVALLASSCVREPKSYGIPPQHHPLYGSGVPEYMEFVDAGDLGADQYFVKDIKTSEGGAWRWTHANPELRFHLPRETSDRNLIVEFTIHETTFRETGSVSISFYVNDHLIRRERYDSPGDKTFARVVASKMLRSGGENRVRMQVHNLWQTQDPGVKLGVIFRRAGFARS